MFDGDGTKLGEINDPWRCCTMNNVIYGPGGEGVRSRAPVLAHSHVHASTRGHACGPVRLCWTQATWHNRQ
jgi:hypothetical protein